MSKERLEEHTHVAVKVDEYKELKEQAKRVQELESDKEEMYKLNQELGRKAWGIEQQNKRYREALKQIEENTDGSIRNTARKALEGEE